MLCTETASFSQVEKYKVSISKPASSIFYQVMQKHFQRTKLSTHCPTKIIGSKIDFSVSRVMHLSFSLVSVYNSAVCLFFTVLSVEKVGMAKNKTNVIDY